MCASEFVCVPVSVCVSVFVCVSVPVSVCVLFYECAVRKFNISKNKNSKCQPKNIWCSEEVMNILTITNLYRPTIPATFVVARQTIQQILRL
jgi:hypothetical protein